MRTKKRSTNSHEITRTKTCISCRSIVKQQGKELPVDFRSVGNRWHAFEQRIIRSRTNAFAKNVDDGAASGAVAAVLVRTMDHQRVMKRTLALLQFNRHRLKLCFLLFVQ